MKAFSHLGSDGPVKSHVIMYEHNVFRSVTDLVSFSSC